MLNNFGFRKPYPDLPDFYDMTIKLVTGEKLSLEVASHQIINRIFSEKVNDEGLFLLNKDKFPILECVGPNPIPYLEIWTKEDKCHLIPMSSITNLEFGKTWSKIVANRDKELKEEKK